MRLPYEVRIAFFELIAKAYHIDGAAIGGSIAQGKKFIRSDDIDATLMLSYQDDFPTHLFVEKGLFLHVKSCLYAYEMTTFARDMFRPQTIYVFRSEKERNIWGGPSPLEAEVYLLERAIS